MKKLIAVGLLAGMMTVTATQAATLAQWTFETNTPADLTNSANGPSVSAEVGTGTASGVHASASSDWTTPAGTASANSYSVNEWAINDYIQFTTTTTGFGSLSLSWYQTSSGTGPRDFKLSYSTNGTSFTDFASYSVLPNASPNTTWSSGGALADYSEYLYTYNLSSVSALNNKSTVYFRLIDTSTTSANGTTVATTGTARVDNFTITATAVPEPHEYALAVVGLLGAMIFMRRRQANRAV